MKRTAGVTLLETVMAALLIGVVGVSATLGTQFATQRQAAARTQQQVLNWMHEELAVRKSQAMRGALTSGLDVTVTRNLSGQRNASLRTQTATLAEAGNVIQINLTATYSDPAARTLVVRSAAFNNRLPRIISVQFAPSSVPAIPATSFSGYFPAANWNRVSTISANSLKDHQGSSVSLTVSTTLNSFQDLNTNVVTTGANASGENFASLFRGANSNGVSTPTYTFTLSSVPYSRYDVVLYVNVPANGSGVDGTVQLNGGPSRSTLAPISATDSPRQDYQLGRNTVLFSNLSNPNPSFVLSGTGYAPPLHGIQVVERI